MNSRRSVRPKLAAWAASFVAAVALTVFPGGLSAQDAQRPVRVDSIAVLGSDRVTRATILASVPIEPGQTATYLDIQRAQKNLWATGEFEDIQVRAQELPSPAGPRVVLTIQVHERPLIRAIEFRGLEHASESQVRDSAQLFESGPYSPQAVRRARQFSQRKLAAEGIPFARVEDRLVPLEGTGNVADLIVDVTEGNRVSVADVVVEGNENVPTSEIVAAMATRPEGFWWFRAGSYDPDRYAADLQDNIPQAYTSRGFLDFRVLSDTLVIDPETGKARIEIHVEEGPQYTVADLAIEGNQYLATERIEQFFQVEEGGLLQTLGLGAGQQGGEITGRVFDAVAFNDAVQEVRESYANEGYIFAQVQPFVEKREPAATGEAPTVRVGVNIREGSPAIINRIAIEGNDYTHEWVIRDKIFLLPGDTYSQDRVLQSYQSIASLGFFETPLPVPDIQPDEETGLVDLTFKVAERQTGSVNFGSSVGGGTGLGGFVGYDQPNLFGQAKEAHLRWDFGRYLNNFTLSFADPALFQTRMSGSISLFNSTDRFIQFRNGRRRRIGASVQIGFPVPWDPRARIFTGYSISRTKLTLAEGVEDASIFGQPDGVQSQVQLGVTRSTVNHPLFPTVGTRLSWNMSLSGGLLGGDGDFTKHTLEGVWWVPIAQVGDATAGRPIVFALGLSARAGAIFGDAARFPFDRFWMGGVQFGQQLRGYDETSVTPLGYFPENASGIQDVNRLGDGFFSLGAELAIRLSDAISISSFMDAGNVWRNPGEIDPTRLFRGAGVGVQLVTPFGPLGLDYAYGFDKTVPGWQLHFKMGGGL